MINLTLPYPPSVNSYYRAVRGRVLVSREGRAYRSAVGISLVMQRMRARLARGRLGMIIDRFPPDHRARDIDNTQKSFLDALQHAQVYGNDAQIGWMLVRDCEVVPDGKIEAHLWRIEDGWPDELKLEDLVPLENIDR